MSETPNTQPTHTESEPAPTEATDRPRGRAIRVRRVLAVVAGVAMVPALYAAASAVTGGADTPKTVSVGAAGADDPATHDTGTETEVEHGVVTTVPEATTSTAPTTPTATVPEHETEVEHGVETTVPETEPGDDHGAPAPTPAPPVTQSFTSAGGSIEVTLADGALSLTSSSPAAGFTPQVHDNGPERVEVRFFDSSGNEWRIRVEASGGALTSEITSHG
jgi:hypothetical protein